MRSERVGASVGLCGADGLEAGDEVESGVCEFEGAELAGVEFCAHRATLLANNMIKSQLRIEIILPPCMFTEACSLKHAPQTCSSNMGRAEGLQALARRFELRVPASLLLDEVILDAANTLSGLEDALPIRLPFPEQGLVADAGVRRPVFTMDGANASRVGSDPCDRVGTGLQASSHVLLQHHRGLRVLGDNLDRTRTGCAGKFGLMVVVSGLETGGLQRFGGEVQFVGNGLPAIGAGLRIGPSQDDVLGAENQIEVASAVDVFRVEVIRVIVRGIAAHAEIV